MTRIHSHRRGKAHSTRPTSTQVPGWLTYSQDEISTLIVKLAKDGSSPSRIGVKLRDEYNIPLVKPILGKGIVEVLTENSMKPTLPEELDRLLSRSRELQSHLNNHKGDRKNVRSLELVEAKIHRMSKYYKKTGILSPTWKYKTAVAQLA